MSPEEEPAVRLSQAACSLEVNSLGFVEEQKICVVSCMSLSTTSYTAAFAFNELNWSKTPWKLGERILPVPVQVEL